MHGKYLHLRLSLWPSTDFLLHNSVNNFKQTPFNISGFRWRGSGLGSVAEFPEGSETEIKAAVTWASSCLRILGVICFQAHSGCHQN